jgi:hypothetical protein
MNFNSIIVSGQFVVNRIESFGSNKYLYMFTEFNQNIINDLIATTYSVSISNLNKYSSDTE